MTVILTWALIFKLKCQNDPKWDCQTLSGTQSWPCRGTRRRCWRRPSWCWARWKWTRGGPREGSGTRSWGTTSTKPRPAWKAIISYACIFALWGLWLTLELETESHPLVLVQYAYKQYALKCFPIIQNAWLTLGQCKPYLEAFWQVSCTESVTSTSISDQPIAKCLSSVQGQMDASLDWHMHDEIHIA